MCSDEPLNFDVLCLLQNWSLSTLLKGSLFAFCQCSGPHVLPSIGQACIGLVDPPWAVQSWRHVLHQVLEDIARAKPTQPLQVVSIASHVRAHSKALGQDMEQENRTTVIDASPKGRTHHATKQTALQNAQLYDHLCNLF